MTKSKYHFTRAPKQEFMDACAILKIAGHVSRLVYLEAMWEMAVRYPDRGWEEAAKSLEAWYEAHELKTEVGQKAAEANGLEFKVA